MTTKSRFVRTGRVIDDVREIAAEHGYAVGVHGSLRAERDIDLIAVPWWSGAHAVSTLVKAIEQLPYLSRRRDKHFARPIKKAHGRQGFVFWITLRAAGCPAYVDLSVMPRG